MRRYGAAVLLFAGLALGRDQSLIHRSQAARHDFVYGNKRKHLLPHLCPATGKAKLPCPGYVIDHVKALACGGADAPSNMQWESVADAKVKDHWERKQPGCPGITCPSWIRTSGGLIDLCKTTPAWAAIPTK